MIPIYSDHFQVSPVPQECTLEEFCKQCKIPFSKLNVFPELGALKDPIKWKNVRDIILMDKVVCGLCVVLCYNMCDILYEFVLLLECRANTVLFR